MKYIPGSDKDKDTKKDFANDNLHLREGQKRLALSFLE